MTDSERLHKFLATRLDFKFRVCWYYPDGKEANIEIDSETLTYAHLKAVSDALQTDAINVGSRRDNRGCDTCGHGSSTVIELDVMKIAAFQ